MSILVSLSNLKISKLFVYFCVLKFVVFLVGKAGIPTPEGVEHDEGGDEDGGGKERLSPDGSVATLLSAYNLE